MSTQNEERWVHGHSLNTSPQFLVHFRIGEAFLFNLFLGQYTTLFASIPAPDPTKGWRIKSLMLRYFIWAPYSEFGLGGKISWMGIHDGERSVWWTRLNNSLTTNGYEIIKVDLPEPTTYNYGLGVGIGASYDFIYGAPQYTMYRISSVGVEFLMPN